MGSGTDVAAATSPERTASARVAEALKARVLVADAEAEPTSAVGKESHTPYQTSKQRKINPESHLCCSTPPRWWFFPFIIIKSKIPRSV